jgi:hypothetical protein
LAKSLAKSWQGNSGRGSGSRGGRRGGGEAGGGGVGGQLAEEEKNNCDKIEQPSPGRWGTIFSDFKINYCKFLYITQLKYFQKLDFDSSP